MAAILYLYSKFMPYQVPVVEELVSRYNAEVHVVYWDTKGNAPYEPPVLPGVTFYRKSTLDYQSLRRLTDSIHPDILYVPGWQDNEYLRIASLEKKRGIPVVTGFDEIWRGTLRQVLGRLYFPLVLRRYYTHAWVSGPRQYEFARKLGFRDHEILYHLYSGDTRLFSRAYEKIETKRLKYPKRFLFVGRMVPAKGIDILANGFRQYRERGGEWDLTAIGNGPLKPLLDSEPGVTTHAFMEQSIILQLLDEVGAFVLPSRFDVSPLVVHEFASAGLPLLLSSAIGNRLLFLIDQFNGLSFETENADSLSRQMTTISNLPVDQLISMGRGSRQLSMAHNAEFVAASLVSLVSRAK